MILSGFVYFPLKWRLLPVINASALPATATSMNGISSLSISGSSIGVEVIFMPSVSIKAKRSSTSFSQS